MSSTNQIKHPDLIREIEAHCAAAEMAASAFGRMAVGDGSLVSDIKSGRELRAGTIERIRRFMWRSKPEPERASPVSETTQNP